MKGLILEPQPMRRLYIGDDTRDQSVAKLTTRVPYVLRAAMKSIASNLQFGYRTQTQMYSSCLVEFLKQQPWDRGLAWRISSESTNFVRQHIAEDGEKRSSRKTTAKKIDEVSASEEIALFHIYFEPLDVDGRHFTGVELKEYALRAADLNHVNQAAFALTFLWWLALHRHPFSDPAVVEQLMAAPGARNY